LHGFYHRIGDGTLSHSEEQHRGVAVDTPESIQVSLADLLTMLWQRRRFLALVTGIGVLLAIGYSLLLPNQYESTAQLMPADQQSLSSGSLLSALTGSGQVASIGGLMKTPGGTFIGILGSRTAQDDLINRFDLRRMYHCKFYVDCRGMLAAQTAIKENLDDGIISITVIDRDRYRARDLAQAYVDELDKLVNSLSTSSARREREFLEQRLKSIKSDLDASSIALSQFSSHNATINPQSQGQALIESLQDYKANWSQLRASCLG
jgi:uncharacterized protein involved in exopolysaccharide biosynthesis